MSKATAIRRIVVGLLSDIEDYRQLRGLLEAQFTAALRHRAAEIEAIVAGILEVVGTLEERRRERTELATALLGGRVSALGPSVDAVAQRVPAAARADFTDCCARLESLVRECKRLNRRNANVLMAQRDVMERTLRAEVHTYAPA